MIAYNTDHNSFASPGHDFHAARGDAAVRQYPEVDSEKDRRKEADRARKQSTSGERSGNRSTYRDLKGWTNFSI